MLIESHVSTIFFSVSLIIFIISIFHNMIAARVMDAPNNNVYICGFATLFSFSLLALFIFILNLLNIFFNDSFYFIFLSFTFIINTIAFSLLFNVGFMAGTLIIIIGYMLTIAIVAFAALVALYFMGFESYREIIELTEPYIYDLLSLIRYVDF